MIQTIVTSASYSFPSVRMNMNASRSHTKALPHFLLVGNGPYLNRGCEAIVRGTMAILCQAFGEGFRVRVAK
jgi:hypothetical protein